MAELTWDDTGERTYETGVDHGVLFIPDGAGVYNNGVAWNGLVTVTESPSGAEASPQYADNMKYLNLTSAEEFGATIEAFTYPDEFAPFDGLGVPVAGVTIGQQRRGTFGFSYRTKKGNDIDGDDHGYKIHLVYGATAAPSEKAYSTVNDSPEPITFSWEVTTVPVAVTDMRPTALVVIDSTKVDSGDLAAFEQILYGDTGVDPRMPLPDEIVTIFGAGALVEVTPVAPTLVGDDLTIPSVTGLVYLIEGEPVTGTVVITGDTLVVAETTAGYRFPDTEPYDADWLFEYP